MRQNSFVLIILSLGLRVCYGFVETCCNYENDTEKLFECVKGRSNGSDTSVDVAIISYTTPQTFQYASYALAINQAYAKRHGYAFLLVDHEEYNHDEDPRWNKIRLIRSALQKHYSFVVWMDSDLAIINHSLEIEKISDENPTAHVIMSRDMATAPFVSNSGVIIVKNSAWSVSLMDLWWSSYDRTKCCDQNAFTWMYERQFPPDIRTRTALLPSSAINSDFPAWLNQKETDHVLHLAGQSSLYRSVVFRTGFHAVCVSESKQTPLSHQLGLDREYLFDVMRSMNLKRAGVCKSLVAEIDNVSTSYAASSVRAIRRRLEDVLKVDDDEKNHLSVLDLSLIASIHRDVLILRRWIADSLMYHAHQRRLSARTQNDSALRLLVHEEVREAIGVAFELCVAIRTDFTGKPSVDVYSDVITESAEKQPLDGESCWRGNFVSEEIVTIMSQCLDVINAVLSERYLSPAVKGSFLYHRFKTFQFLAGAFQRDNSPSCNASHSIAHLTLAVDSWKQMVKASHFDSQYVLADPYKEYTTVVSELALLHCLRGTHQIGIGLFVESLELQEQMITGFSNIKIASTTIIWLAMITISTTAINAAICCVQSDCNDDVHAISAITKSLAGLRTNTEFRNREPEKYDEVSRFLEVLNSRHPAKKLRLKRKKS